jgi:hypothetical protein
MTISHLHFGTPKPFSENFDFVTYFERTGQIDLAKQIKHGGSYRSETRDQTPASHGTQTEIGQGSFVHLCALSSLLESRDAHGCRESVDLDLQCRACGSSKRVQRGKSKHVENVCLGAKAG